jgi:SAM-dependent methyltransferase
VYPRRRRGQTRRAVALAGLALATATYDDEVGPREADRGFVWYAAGSGSGSSVACRGGREDNGSMADDPARRALPPDYDRDPDRFRTARSVIRRHAWRPTFTSASPHASPASSSCLVLDVGCGEGELARHLPDGGWLGVDSSMQMLLRAPEPQHLPEATALPFADASSASVALLYMLYHVPDPERALAEAHRVLRPEGLVAVAAPSRHDAPELAHALPRSPLTFDAELAPELLAGLFTDIRIERWDAPLLELPTKVAVRGFLIGKGVEPAAADAAAGGVEVPLLVTKRGALAFARKRR